MADTIITDPTLLTKLASFLNASEPALRLLLSLLIGYPIILFHRWTLYRSSPLLQHLFFILSGFSIGYFNYGSNVIHSVICVVATWLLIASIGGTKLSVIIAFIFQMSYLLIGYYVTGTDTYDIKWTMPHCVLTLRLIALTFDVYDGARDKSTLSKNQLETALYRNPSIIEVASHTYFPASFMVGPQFSMNRYLKFIEGRMFSDPLPPSLHAGLARGALGIFYICVYQAGTLVMPENYLTVPQYFEHPFWMRAIIVGLWGKITLYKYISCWLITEGVCIISGLAYSGTVEGEKQFKGCANVKVQVFEYATQFDHLINSFNINTNSWIAEYVYKRLKFLNNRYMSQGCALVFLAVWHGLHSGYYACFFMEFLVMYLEKDFAGTIKKYPELTSKLDSGPMKIIKWVVMKFYVLIFMGYCLGPFVLLKSSRWWQFYKSLYFMGHIFFGGWAVYGIAVKKLLKIIYPRKATVKTEEQTSLPQDSVSTKDKQS